MAGRQPSPRSGRPAGAPVFRHVYGVDFSGAKLAGRAAWVARADVTKDRLILRELNSLEKLCGCAERDQSLVEPVEFFSFLRNFTADGFFTSKIGIRYLGYKGNTFLTEFPGCPPVPGV